MATLSKICPIETSTTAPSSPNQGGSTVMKTQA